MIIARGVAKNKGVKVEFWMDSMVGGSVQLLSFWNRLLSVLTLGPPVTWKAMLPIIWILLKHWNGAKHSAKSFPTKFCPIFPYQDFLQLPLSKPKAPVWMPSNAQMLSLSTQEPGTMPKKGKDFNAWTDISSTNQRKTERSEWSKDRPSLSWFLIMSKGWTKFYTKPAEKLRSHQVRKMLLAGLIVLLFSRKKMQAGIRKFFWKKLGNMLFVPSPLILGST